MPDPNAGLPPRYLRTPEAARFSACPAVPSRSTAPTVRARATRKLGGRVVYAVTDLQAWVNRGTKASTSDDTGETVLPAKRHAAISPAYAGAARR